MVTLLKWLCRNETKPSFLQEVTCSKSNLTSHSQFDNNLASVQPYLIRIRIQSNYFIILYPLREILLSNNSIPLDLTHLNVSLIFSNLILTSLYLLDDDAARLFLFCTWHFLRFHSKFVIVTALWFWLLFYILFLWIPKYWHSKFTLFCSNFVPPVIAGKSSVVLVLILTPGKGFHNEAHIFLIKKVWY